MKRNLLKLSTLLFLSMLNGSAFSQEMPKFNSDQEKEAWIKENPAIYESMMNKSESVNTATIQNVNPSTNKVDLPGFPQYVNTGNPEVDSKSYNEAKTKWVAENKKAYDNYLNQEANTTTVKSINDLPGFPVFTSTGDFTADMTKYQKEKEKWYADNQELVKEFMSTYNQK